MKRNPQDHITLRARLLAVGLGLVLLLAALPVAYLLWPARVPVAGPVDSGALATLYGLQQHDGQQVTRNSYQGRWLLVFFGFTHCPDICPTTLSSMAGVLKRLGDDAALLQPLFITLDPERDTPEQLAAYVSFFDERIVGLTGTIGQIQGVADAYGIYFRKVPSNDSYLLDHSSTALLLGPDGQLLERFSQQATADDMLAGIVRVLGRDRGAEADSMRSTEQ
ncbi:SCO family protein [Halopseudomonas xiamenensis]|uniref:SCO family protein n=1 Tax=Halopseudomonas xiamenensis TaxID=157792 RepID=UPI001623504C|nr:SCO family protein [Halopseudomonas xiamenensis]